MPDFIKIIDKFRIPVHKLNIFNPIWEKESLLRKVSADSPLFDDSGDNTFHNGLDRLLLSVKNLKTNRFQQPAAQSSCHYNWFVKIRDYLPS
jgi:hypothetical protein